MKNKILFFGMLIAAMMILSAGTICTYGQSAKMKMQMKDSTKYTCKMHPEVIQDHPGKCPKCGMTLVVANGKGQMNTSSDKMNMMGDSTRMKKHGMMKGSKDMEDDKMKTKKDSFMMYKEKS